MDIPRDPRPAKRKRIIIGTIVVVAIGSLSLAVQALPSAVPTVPDATNSMV